jgi:ADP-heptose:LPS heptosyltransferase
VPLQEQTQPARILITADGDLEAQDWLVRHRVSGGKPLLALHPGASDCGKRWPLDRFQSVAAFLESSHDFLIIEGPAEPGLAAELGRSLRPEGYVIAASLPLGLLAAILSSCHAYLGNDSGISHLAAALGLRSVVIFGPTQPEQWAPSGPGVDVLRDTTGCAACGGAGGDRHSCLENVTVEHVRDCLTGLRAG